jgi:hypothetical protein
MHHPTRGAARLLFLAAALAVSACEQLDQSLPFDAGTEVSREVPSDGLVISSSAGASFRVPAGALPPASLLTLTPQPAPEAGPAGSPVARNAFRIDAGSSALVAPLGAELRLDRASADAWLAAATISNGAALHEVGDASVDLGAGLLRTSLPALGLVVAVVPASDARVPVRPLEGPTHVRGIENSASVGVQTALATRALVGDCGGVGRRCQGVRIDVGPRLFDYVDQAAVLFPRIDGRLDLAGTGASGELIFHAPLRARLNGGAAAVTVPLVVTARATPATLATDVAGTITLSNMQLMVRSAGAETTASATLTIRYEGTAAWLTVERSLAATFGTVPESIPFRAEIPLVRIP